MKLLEKPSLEFLQSEIENLRKKIIELQSENISLKEQLEWFQRQIFGKRSERIVKDLDDRQLYFEGFEKTPTPPQEKQLIQTHFRKKPARDGGDQITLPDNLPVERVILDIPKEKKVCPDTGKPLVKIGEEVTRKLARKPESYYIKEFVRPKYALPKGEGIEIADLPESFIPKCRADESLLADILTKKFADHLPLYRIAEGLAREGIGMSRQLLSQWVVKIGKGLEPLYKEMLQRVLKSKSIFVDESPVDLQWKGKGQTHQAYMWVLVGGEDAPYQIYDFRLTRKHDHILKLLKDYRGVLHSDKYGAYETLANQKQIIWSPCYSHIRRKFIEAESGDPSFRQWVLRKIRYLFLFERIAWSRSPEERLKIRQEKEVPIIDELIKAIKGKLINGKILPKSKFRTALGYFCGLIPYLKNYTKYPFAHLDNNRAERAIRPLALGRKNWLFVGSPDGGDAAACILSLVQTCRTLGINPREYLEDLLRRFMSHSNQKLHEFFPDNWAKNHLDTS